MKPINFALLPLCACLLTACGGGSSSSESSKSSDLPNTMQSAPLSVLVTDDLSTEYDEVWVTIYQVHAQDENNQDVELFKNNLGKTINVRELAGVGSLLNMDNFPVQNYDNIKVDLDSKITLVKTDGATINARFSNSQDKVSLPVNGSLNLSTQQANNLLIDFDLSQFNYNSNDNIVNGKLVQKNITSLEHVQAEVKGVITQINSDSQLKMKIGNQAPITVSLSNAALVSDHGRNTLSNDTKPLQVGNMIEVKGNYDSTNKVLLARTIEVEQNNQSSRDRIEGIVRNVNGSSIEFDLTQANFLPDRDHIYLNNMANAYFERGNNDNLIAGQKVNAKGYWNGNQFITSHIEVEGGVSKLDQDSSSNKERYIELKGTLNINAQTNQIKVSNVEHSQQIRVNDFVNLDLSKAWYEHGMSKCMTQGAQVELKGAYANNIFKVSSVEIARGCTTTYREEYEYEHGDKAYDERSSTQVSSIDDRDSNSSSGSSSTSYSDHDRESERDSSVGEGTYDNKHEYDNEVDDQYSNSSSGSSSTSYSDHDRESERDHSVGESTYDSERE